MRQDNNVWSCITSNQDKRLSETIKSFMVAVVLVVRLTIKLASDNMIHKV